MQTAGDTQKIFLNQLGKTGERVDKALGEPNFPSR